MWPSFYVKNIYDARIGTECSDLNIAIVDKIIYGVLRALKSR